MIIVGSSRLGLDILQLIENSHSCFEYVFSGYVDDQGPAPLYQDVNMMYLGKVKDLIVQPKDKYIIAVDSVALRIKLVEFISGAGGNFLSYIHPTAVLGNSVTKGEGVFVGPYCFVADHCHLGSFSVLKSRNLIRKYASIGMFCLLAENALVGKGISLGVGNYLGEGSVIKSVKTSFPVEYSGLEKENPINFQWDHIPWISLN